MMMWEVILNEFEKRQRKFPFFDIEDGVQAKARCRSSHISYSAKVGTLKLDLSVFYLVWKTLNTKPECGLDTTHVQVHVFP